MLPMLIVFVLVVALLLFLDCRKPANFPPGPRWYPIVGSALAIHRARVASGMLCRGLLHLANQYDNNSGVIGLKVGKDNLIVVTGSDSAREMLCNEDLDGRPTDFFYKARTWGQRKGILMTDGDFWMVQRRFLVRHLKEFGFARRGMVEMIQNEAEHMFTDFRNILRQQGGTEALISMQNAFVLYPLNTLWTMMAGIRYERENLELKELQGLLHDHMAKIDMTGCLFSHFPLLRFIAPKFSGYKQFVDTYEAMYTFLGNEVDTHKRSLKPDSEPNDMMDAYLRELLNPQRKQSFTERQLLAICLDMFMAGSETTTKTIGFAMLHLVRRQDIQARVQAELDEVVGRGRLPMLEDRINLPYCDAVVLEALRMFGAYSFGLAHRALRDTKLSGYDIPKNSSVIVCYSGVIHDIFDDSLTFRPERFYQGGKVVVPEIYQPFGAGKHRCIGEIMARSNLFLFIMTLMQNFTFAVPPGHEMPSLEPLDGATPSVCEYTALMTAR